VVRGHLFGIDTHAWSRDLHFIFNESPFAYIDVLHQLWHFTALESVLGKRRNGHISVCLRFHGVCGVNKKERPDEDEWMERADDEA
jgi:hypothetical protein